MQKRTWVMMPIISSYLIVGTLLAKQPPLLRHEPNGIAHIALVEIEQQKDHQYDVFFYHPQCGHCIAIMDIILNYASLPKIPLYFVDISNSDIRMPTPTLNRYICQQKMMEVHGRIDILNLLELNLDIG